MASPPAQRLSQPATSDPDRDAPADTPSLSSPLPAAGRSPQLVYRAPWPHRRGPAPGRPRRRPRPARATLDQGPGGDRERVPMSRPPDHSHLARWRADTPEVARLNHLNNAGAALAPLPVRRAVAEYLDREAALGGYEAAEASADQVRGASEAVGALIGARGRNIALTQNPPRPLPRRWPRSISMPATASSPAAPTTPRIRSCTWRWPSGSASRSCEYRTRRKGASTRGPGAGGCSPPARARGGRLGPDQLRPGAAGGGRG